MAWSKTAGLRFLSPESREAGREHHAADVDPDAVDRDFLAEQAVSRAVSCS